MAAADVGPPPSVDRPTGPGGRALGGRPCREGHANVTGVRAFGRKVAEAVSESSLD